MSIVATTTYTQTIYDVRTNTTKSGQSKFYCRMASIWICKGKLVCNGAISNIQYYLYTKQQHAITLTRCLATGVQCFKLNFTVRKANKSSVEHLSNWLSNSKSATKTM